MKAEQIAILMPLAAALLDTMQDKVKLSDEQTAANKAIEAGTLAAVKVYAIDSRNAGISGTDANTFLRNYLGLSGKPKGTAANYGRAAEGFMRLLEQGRDIAAATAPDAQDAMRSDEQVLIDAGRAALKPYITNCNAEQLDALLAYAKELGVAPKVSKTKAAPVKADAEHAPEALQAAQG